MIDNFDSFTFNLVHYLEQLDASIKVVMNNQISIEQIRQLKPSHIILSPGPGCPQDAGISAQVVEAFKGKVPILGVCLGHQVIAEVFGSKIVMAAQVMHGKTSLIEHKNQGLFNGVKTPFVATRYHSLVIDPKSLGDELEMTAWTQQENDQPDQVMAIQHKSHAIFGVQFHPESVLTESGLKILANFVAINANNHC